MTCDRQVSVQSAGIAGTRLLNRRMSDGPFREKNRERARRTWRAKDGRASSLGKVFAAAHSQRPSADAEGDGRAGCLGRWSRLEESVSECKPLWKVERERTGKEQPMYVSPNFKTKKALRKAVADGAEVTTFQPGPFGGREPKDGWLSVEGPHYPKPHTWYARVEVKDGKVVKVQ